MDVGIISLLKDWVIPLVSVVVSIWFAASAKKDADRADSLLLQINEAIQGWQSKIMGSATNILDSLPQVLEGKVTLAKMQAIESIIEMIRQHAQNPSKLPADEHDRTMIALSAQLNMLLEK